MSHDKVIDQPAQKSIDFWLRKQNAYLDDDELDPEVLLSVNQASDTQDFEIEIRDQTLGSPVAPVNGEVVSYFHHPRRQHHEGIDIASPRGTGIRAAWAGEVAYAFCGGGKGGCTVTLKHANGMSTYYAHLNGTPYVRRGQIVAQGSVIGSVGNTGSARSGPTHLHFEVRTGHRPVNPLGYVHP